MRARRLRSAFLAGCLPFLFLVACGEDPPAPASSGSTPSTTSAASVTEAPTTKAPSPADADCEHGTPLATVAVREAPVGFVETTDHRYLCMETSAGRFVPFGLDPNPPALAEARFAGFGVAIPGGAVYQFLLSERPADPVIVRDESGMTAIYVLSTDGRQLAVFEPHGSAETTLPQPFGRTWTIVNPSGAVLETLRTPAAPAETATSTSVASVVTATTPITTGPAPPGYSDYDTPRCLYEHGLSAQDPQPYSPEVAVPAWQACRDLMAKGMEMGGMPPEKIAEFMAYYDCMAAQGWIWIQAAAHDASAECGRA